MRTPPGEGSGQGVKATESLWATLRDLISVHVRHVVDGVADGTAAQKSYPEA
jgi:hypothetical protein